MLLSTHSEGNMHFIELENKNVLVMYAMSTLRKLILKKKTKYHLNNALPGYCIAVTQAAAF